MELILGIWINPICIVSFGLGDLFLFLFPWKSSC